MTKIKTKYQLRTENSEFLLRSLTIPKKVYAEYKKYLSKNGMTLSGRLVSLMKLDMNNNLNNNNMKNENNTK